MWDDGKQSQLNALREKEEQGTLSADEKQELEALYAELDAEESERLRPALERTDEELAEQQQHNAQLAALVEKRKQLLARMDSQIAEWLNEHERLKAEAAQLVGVGESD
jgi:CTP-dependent riboflavin kinase